jgi:hypothetical protein
MVSIGMVVLGDPDFIVLADPEGNRFCVVNTSHGHE